MTDIKELTRTLRQAAEEELMCREASDTSDLWQDEAGPENVLALIEALEKAQQKGAEQGRHACALFDEVVAQRNRLAELDKRLIEYAGIATREALRVAELERANAAQDDHINQQHDRIDVPEECPAELPYAQVKAVADLFALCWQSGEVVTYTPDPEKATIWLNNYSGTCVQEYVKLERLQEALSGNSPVIPGGWISCSERMPEDEQEVIVHNKLGYRYVSYFDEHSGLFFDMRGGNQMNCIEHILVTHWMPAPAAPKPEQS